MKKAMKIALFMCIVLLVSTLVLTACGDKNAPEDNVQETTQEVGGNEQTTPNVGGETTPDVGEETTPDGSEEETTSGIEETTPAPHEHTVVVDSAIAPTCTSSGLTEGKHCATCFEVLVARESIPALGHAEIVDSAVNPTCTTDGKTAGKHCAICNEILESQQTIPSLGHTEVIDKAIAPTCTESGLTEGKHCYVCGNTILAQKVVPQNGHSFGEWYVTKEATEAEKGEKRRDCGACDEFETSPIAELAHDHNNWETITLDLVNPTCTETGLTEGKQCSGCGEILVAQNIIPANGHTEVIDEAVAPTCTETGLTQGEHCSVCNEVLVAQEVVPATGHNEVIDEAVVATCTETGLTQGKHCSICGEVLLAQEVVAATGHIEIIDAAIAPTCTETGLTAGIHCFVCNEILTAQEVVPATGVHPYVTTVTPPTVTSNGYTTYTCPDCGDSYTETIILVDFTITEDNRAMVGYTGEDNENLVIPTVFEYEGTWYKTSCIGERAFEGCRNLVGITIPETITLIDYYAFDNTGLNDVYISDIDAWLNMTPRSHPNAEATLHILDENGEEVTHLDIYEWYSGIREYAFFNAKHLECVYIGNGYSVGYRAFANCTNLWSVYLTSSIESIGQDAFRDCIALYEFVIPECVYYISVDAFNGCYNLYDITIYDNVSRIGQNAFYDTGYYNNYDNWENGVLYLGNYLIATNSWELDDEYNIREGTIAVAEDAFVWDDELKAIGIPESVTHICAGAFYACTNLTDVYYYGDADEWSGIDISWDNECLINANIHFNSNPNGTSGIIYETNGSYATVVGYDGDKTDIVIGRTYEGLPVTKIGAEAFRNNSNITSITIPDSITTIEQYAFAGCGDINSITIGTGVTRIEDWVFENTSICNVYIFDVTQWCQMSLGSEWYSNPFSCSNYVYLNDELLVNLVIPDGITSIGDYAFSNCQTIETITIPDSVTYIGSRAFDNTGYSQNSSNWVNGVLYIGKHLISSIGTLSGEYRVKDGTLTIAENAFSYNYNLTSVIIPDSVVSIGSQAFYNCSNLSNVVMSDELSTIGYMAFKSTPYYENSSYWDGDVRYIGSVLVEAKRDITGEYVIKEGTTAIAYGAFEWTNICSIVIPDSVVTIEDYAFYMCSKLVSVVIGENSNLTTIGKSAFDYCTSLTEIYIPEKVENIGLSAFTNCDHLTGITVAPSNAYYKSVEGVLYSKDGKTLIQYPIGKTDSSFKIPNEVTHIAPYAFYSCYNLSSINVYNCSVEVIGEYAFAYCKGINMFYFSSSLREIHDNALYACTNTSWVIIHSDVSYIGAEVFSGCYSLDTIDVYGYDGNFKSIGGVLYTADSKTLVKYPQAKKESHYSVPDGVTTIASDAFYYCRYLTSVSIPKSVVAIGDGAFVYCENLVTVTFEESSALKRIGKSTFYDCDKLAIIKLPEGLIEIGESAFDCNHLVSITIPSTVVKVGNMIWPNLIEIINYSGIDFSPYINENGETVRHAEFVHNGESKIVNQNGYLFVTIDDIHYLVGYVGNLTKLTLPDSFNGESYVVRKNAFDARADITHLIISSGVVEIEESAFRYCQNLVSVTLGENLAAIGEGAFASCYRLVEVINNGSSLHLTKGSEDNGQIAYYALEIHTGESKLSNVNNYLFYTYEGENYLVNYIGDESNIVLLSLYNGETYKIHNYAFFYKAMSSVRFSDGITEIGDYAFSYCHMLTEITIGNNVTNIGYYAFGQTSSLRRVTISASVTNIDFIAFADMYAIDSIIFEDAEGWIVTDETGENSIEISAQMLSNPLTATRFLNETYRWYTWSKSN